MIARRMTFVLAALFLPGLAALRLHDALIETKSDSLRVQCEIIAAVIAGTSLEPEHMAPLLRRLIPGSEMRARVFSSDGHLLVDTQHRPTPIRDVFRPAWAQPYYWLVRSQVSVVRDAGVITHASYPEIEAALTELATTARLVMENGEPIVSAAAPIRRNGPVPAVLLLSVGAGV